MLYQSNAAPPILRASQSDISGDLAAFPSVKRISSIYCTFAPLSQEQATLKTIYLALSQRRLDLQTSPLKSQDSRCLKRSEPNQNDQQRIFQYVFKSSC